MTSDDLRLLQALPLEDKIARSKLRIREWYDHFCGKVYVSFSGGKDSTVLLDLVRSMYTDVPAVFADTGLEYPEIRAFVMRQKSVTVVKPAKNFREVIETEGYPVISKRVAQSVRQYRTTKSGAFKEKILNGYLLPDGRVSRRFSIPRKWQKLLDAPFAISDKCCEWLKKKPFKKFEAESGLASITGEMATDSEIRLRHYLLSGCNAFGYTRPKSTPLGFWTEQDILQYLKHFNVPYCSVYGDITERENGTLMTTGAKRTGCLFCMFGVHLEKGESRFERMKRTHPQLWKYCIYTLGLGNVLSYMGIPFGGEAGQMRIPYTVEETDR
jgi:3'-phosphoadenosine 5'-phosphosulfate sulfotransferase (PAPS reductase)/FAD synthetase